MKGLAFSCAGEALEALPMGALHWPAERLLAVADLHLEKGSSYAVAARKLLPRHDTRQTLGALAALVDAIRPRTVVCLGDTFHDRDAIARLPEVDRIALERLAARTSFVWIAGNHDPAPPPAGWGKLRKRSIAARWSFATRRSSGRPTVKSRGISIPWRHLRYGAAACDGVVS